MSHHVRDPERIAVASLRGYWYQIVYTVDRWLNLLPNSYLVVEGNEDIDSVVRTQHGELHVEEQIKYRAASPSWTTVLPVLRNFAKAFRWHHEKGTRFEAVLRTNVEFKARGESQLEKWVQGESPDIDQLLEELRRLAGRTDDGAEREAIDYVVRLNLTRELVTSVTWACSAPGPESVEEQVLEKLAGRTRRIPRERARDALIVAVLRRGMESEIERRVLRKFDLEMLMNDLHVDQATRDFSSGKDAPELCFAYEASAECVAAVLILHANPSRLANQLEDRGTLLEHSTAVGTDPAGDQLSWLLTASSDFVAYGSVLRSRGKRRTSVCIRDVLAQAAYRWEVKNVRVASGNDVNIIRRATKALRWSSGGSPRRPEISFDVAAPTYAPTATASLITRTLLHYVEFKDLASRRQLESLGARLRWIHLIGEGRYFTAEWPLWA